MRELWPTIRYCALTQYGRHAPQRCNKHMTTIHENYSRNETMAAGSDRSFGMVMTAAFAVISLLNWWHEGHAWRWTIGIAAVFLAATLFYSAALKPLNRLWLKFGMLLHKVVNPIVMALVFFG